MHNLCSICVYPHLCLPRNLYAPTYLFYYVHMIKRYAVMFMSVCLCLCVSALGICLCPSIFPQLHGYTLPYLYECRYGAALSSLTFIPIPCPVESLQTQQGINLCRTLQPVICTSGCPSPLQSCCFGSYGEHHQLWVLGSIPRTHSAIAQPHRGYSTQCNANIWFTLTFSSRTYHCWAHCSTG